LPVSVTLPDVLAFDATKECAEVLDLDALLEVPVN
jgi:hypothetical protein